MPLDNFTQNLLNLLYVFLLSFLMASIIIVCLIGIVFAIAYWKKSRERHERSLETTLLEIALPRDNEIKIDAAEQLFSSLTAIKSAKGILGFLKLAESISFEIVARPQDVRFYVGVTNKLRDMVEKQIHGAYPDAQILEVEDYNLFENPGKVAYASLKSSKSFYLPIKTYKDLPVDPLSSLTSTLGKMQDGEAAALQILISPTGDSFKKSGRDFITTTKKREANPETAKYSVDQKELEAIEQKITKPGFNTYIRILTISSTKESAEAHLANIAGAFSQFSSFNSFDREKLRFFKGMAIVDFIYRQLPLLPSIRNILTI